MKRPVIWIGSLSLLVLAAFIAAGADENAGKPNVPPSATPPPSGGLQPNVSITPRTKIGPSTPDNITDRRADIRIDTDMVLIYVSVTDPIGRYVTGLDKENFKLTEEMDKKKIEQDITQFSSEDAPMSVGVVFDTSGSMGAKLRRSQQAVAQFLKTANPEDEFFLVHFNDRPELLVPWTPDSEEIQSRLTWVESKGRTALLDGVYMAMNQMKKARNPRKAILIISDGGDNESRYTWRELKGRLREADVQVYSIGITQSFPGHRRSLDDMLGAALLDAIAKETGGRLFEVDDLNQLPDTAAKIGTALRNQYMLGYVPASGQHDGKYHRVQVKIARPKGMPRLRASFRSGYQAPTN